MDERNIGICLILSVPGIWLWECVEAGVHRFHEWTILLSNVPCTVWISAMLVAVFISMVMERWERARPPVFRHMHNYSLPNHPYADYAPAKTQAGG